MRACLPGESLQGPEPGGPGERGEGLGDHHHLTLSPGNCDALHASRLSREGAEVHRQGPHAAGEAQE